MPALAMSPVISGTSSGTPSDEDFVSGSSADDQSYIDRLTVDISAFGLGSGVTNGLFLKHSKSSGTLDSFLNLSGPLFSHFHLIAFKALFAGIFLQNFPFLPCFELSLGVLLQIV